MNLDQLQRLLGKYSCNAFFKLYVQALALLCFTSGAVQADQIFRLGTGGSAGSYYPIGSLIAKAINQKKLKTIGDDELIVLPQRSNGSVSNIEDISAGLLEGAIAQADVVSFAYHGLGQFKSAGASDVLCNVGTLYLESMHLVVAENSDIQGVEGLAGKRVSVDELGSGTQLDVVPVLAAYGMTFDDIKPIYLKSVDSIDRMRRGALDAFFVIAGYPVNGVKELVDDGIGRVVSLSGTRMEKLVGEYIYFTGHTIPKNTYSNELEIATIGVSAQLIVRANVNADIVYEITKALWSESTLNALTAGHPRGADIRASTALQGLSIPLHAGALRYYEEMGYDLSVVPR